MPVKREKGGFSEAVYDEFIIEEAEQTEGCSILTNDHFRGQVESGRLNAAWRDRRIVKFTFVENELRPMQYGRKH